MNQDNIQTLDKKASQTITEGITITAIPAYVPENSRPENNEYLFSYDIEIVNNNDYSMKLLSRNWIIIDGDGNSEEISGSGVVGQTPTIEPGDNFKYQSFCPLITSWGTMEGSYQMEKETGDIIEAKINRFFLVASED